MHRYDIDGHIVLSPIALGDGKPEMAVSLASRLTVEHGKMGRTIFLADLLRETGEDPSDVFPTGGSTLARDLRIVRLLRQPVQVDDVVLTFRNKKGRMYEKTKAIDVRVGTLASLYPEMNFGPVRAPTRVDSQSAPDFSSPPAAPAARDVQVPASLLEEIATLQARLEALSAEVTMDLRGRLDAVEAYVKKSGFDLGVQMNRIEHALREMRPQQEVES